MRSPVSLRDGLPNSVVPDKVAMAMVDAALRGSSDLPALIERFRSTARSAEYVSVTARFGESLTRVIHITHDIMTDGRILDLLLGIMKDAVGMWVGKSANAVPMLCYEDGHYFTDDKVPTLWYSSTVEDVVEAFLGKALGPKFVIIPVKILNFPVDV